MKKIAVFGVGRSSIYLLDYLNRESKGRWEIVACDRDPIALSKLTAAFEHIKAQVLDVSDEIALSKLVSTADLVVSLLPPALHVSVAKLCLEGNTHLATASYVSADMKALSDEAGSKGLVFLNEMGLDPGIDHMSAMEMIHDLTAHGAAISSFESYCGGLVHLDDCGTNPWKYKFSWNPMNVILAGQGAPSVFLKDGKLRTVSWNRVFASATSLDVNYEGVYDAYPNRDSLGYKEPYGLKDATTFIRGTLRRENYCKAWQVLVLLGFTDHSAPLPDSISTVAAFIDSITGREKGVAFSDWLLGQGLIDNSLAAHFNFLETNEAEIHLPKGTAAEKLHAWLSQCWRLNEQDRDQVVMYHRIVAEIDGKRMVKHSFLKVDGIDSTRTAMAKTVGLPLAMGAALILTQNMPVGVQVPTAAIWYKPVLEGLKAEGIQFKEFTE